jgi:membrane-bound acyltransferase YfiQ involved in biofilm formation
MVYFIRNKDNRTIVDTEIFIKEDEVGNKFIEIKSSIIIETYSHFLLENINKQDEIIKDFSELKNLRGWLWEKYFMGGYNDSKKYDDVTNILNLRFKEIAKKYNLDFIID